MHGGANVEVVEMLQRVLKGGMSPEDCIRQAKDKANPFKLFGFGHRVYKNYDPRAKILKTACDRVLSQMIEYGGPLLYHGGEDQQRSFDSTCNKLRRFLNATAR